MQKDPKYMKNADAFYGVTDLNKPGAGGKSGPKSNSSSNKSKAQKLDGYINK